VSEEAPPGSPGGPAPAGGSPRRLGRAASLISLATMLSRVLGLLREQLFAALMGAGALADAFNVAFRIPNLLRDLFAEGALSAAFVPSFKATLKRDGAGPAYHLGNVIAGNLLVIVGALTLAAAIFAPQIVDVMAGDFDEIAGKRDLTIQLTRLMLPFLAVVSLAAVAMGMLNAQERFGPPAIAPALFNVVSICVGLTLWAAGVEGRWVAVGWSVGTLLGGLAQLGVQLPPLWRAGWRPRLGLDLALRDPAVRRVALVMAPAVIGVAAMQVNIVINTMFATSEPGAVSWLNYAFRFLQLPIGVFGVAIATVSTTRYADAAADRDPAAMSRHVVEGLRLVAFLTVPATVGLLLLDREIIRLVYQHGAFTAWDTITTAAALRYFAIGLVAYAAVKVIAPAFYAAGLTRIAVTASVVAVAGNVTWNVLLHPHHGYRILALGTSIAALLNVTILYTMFHRRIAPVPHRALLAYLLRIGAAAAVMGVAVWLAARASERVFGHLTIGARLVGALGPVTVGALVYAAACAALRVEELGHLTGRLLRRRRRG
jgi:putative peptidoglycan lipid II flippase